MAKRAGHGLKGTDMAEFMDACQSTSGPRLEQLARSSDGSIVYAVIDNPAVPTSALEWLAANQESAYILAEVVSHPRLPQKYIDAVFTKIYSKKPALAVQHWKAPEFVFHRAAASGNPELALLAASSVRCPLSALATLAAAPTARVRAQVAARRDAASLLPRLAGDHTRWVRAAVAGNPSIDPTTAELLSVDRAITVRESLAQNPSVSQKLQAIAAASARKHRVAQGKSARVTVRATIANMAASGVTNESLVELRQHPAPTVRAAALVIAYSQGLLTLENCWEKLNLDKASLLVTRVLHLVEPVKAMRLLLLTGREVSLDAVLHRGWRKHPEIAELAVESGNYAYIAQATNFCPLDTAVLDQIAQLPVRGCYLRWDGYRKYAEAFVGNTSQRYKWFHPAVIAARHRLTSPETLAQLRTSRDVRVMAALVMRMKTAELQQAARGPREVRIAVAKRRATPPSVLSLLATDPDAEVRRAVLANPRTGTVDRALLVLGGVA